MEHTRKSVPPVESQTLVEDRQQIDPGGHEKVVVCKVNPCFESSPRHILGARLIRYKARQLVGKIGLTESDREDLIQEMTLDLLERLPNFNPDKAALSTFVARVIDRKISKIIRYRTQEMRDYRCESCSLNDFIEDADGEAIERVHTISQDACEMRLGNRQRTREEEAQLRFDVLSVLSSLPDDLREIAEHLQKESVSQAARSLGIPRTTLYGSIERLCLIFENAGLKDYLPTDQPDAG